MHINTLKAALYSTYIGLSSEEREGFLHDLINGLYRNIKEKAPVRPTGIQRKAYIKSLSGKIFTHKRENSSISFEDTVDGKFMCNNNTYKSPCGAVEAFYKSDNKVKSTQNNAWQEAIDEEGKSLDDYIQEFLIK
jgi:hypothetical protein